MKTQQYCQRWYLEIFFLFFVMVVPNSTLGKVKPIDTWGVTQMKTIKVNYVWTIDNFSLHNEKLGEYFESPPFSSPKNNTIKWTLRMCPHGESSNYKDDIGIYLVYSSGPMPSITASSEISLLNISGAKQSKLTRKLLFERGISWGSPSFIKRAYLLDEKNGIIANDRIHVYAEVSYNLTTKSISGDCVIRGKSDMEDQFSDHLEPLLESGNFSDAVVVVRGKRFPVHKAILAARSSVFLGIFSNGEKDPVVQAIDVEPDIMKEALRYIYTGKVRNLEWISEELLRVATTYKISGLQALCEENLCQGLRIKNAVDVLSLAERYKADELKSKAVGFIAGHIDEFINTDKFKAFQNSHPDVIVDVFNAALKNGSK